MDFGARGEKGALQAENGLSEWSGGRTFVSGKLPFWDGGGFGGGWLKGVHTACEKFAIITASRRQIEPK